MRFKPGDMVVLIEDDSIIGGLVMKPFVGIFIEYAENNSNIYGDCYIDYKISGGKSRYFESSDCIWYAKGRHVLTEVVIEKFKGFYEI